MRTKMGELGDWSCGSGMVELWFTIVVYKRNRGVGIPSICRGVQRIMIGLHVITLVYNGFW